MCSSTKRGRKCPWILCQRSKSRSEVSSSSERSFFRVLDNQRSQKSTGGDGAKGKGHTTTHHDGPEGKEMYSSTLSLISALDGVSGQSHAPAVLPPGKSRYPL
jgi:hypothetical protein